MFTIISRTSYKEAEVIKSKRVGIMVPLFSLPGNFGIGDIDSMYQFIDQLEGSGVSVIQLLPMNAVSGDETSPYSGISAFAVNPVYISLRRLKYLDAELENWEVPERINYSAVNTFKFAHLRASYDNFLTKATPLDRKRLRSFKNKTEEWLSDYSLFHALSHEHKKAFWDWPKEHQNPVDASSWAKENQQKVEFFTYLQWICFEQWQGLKDYADSKGIHFMGDLPLYVSKNSADAWSRPDVFRKGVHAGVPPDIYAEDGQDWGNPIYDWKVMAKDGYQWWKDRVKWLKEFCDLVRIDHIRGIYSYWAVPDGALPKDVKSWTPGPKSDLIDALKETGMELIGEDLGDIPPAVDKWMNNIKVPGYKVFLFGWGNYESEKYRFTEEYPTASLACTSTHDSESYWEFLEALSDPQIYELGAYLGIQEGEEFTIDDLRKRSIKKLIDSPSRYVMFPLQDVLGKGIRINTPGSVSEDNWSKVISVGDQELKSLSEFSALIKS
ncbi:MAG: 4-alpha-glucanotransferase [bacterium]|nr:4-alpha-glucanotransferase [bacterium]